MAVYPEKYFVTFADMLDMVNNGPFFAKEAITATTEHATKTQIIQKLWLDGNPPLANFQSNEHIPFDELHPLGTVWVGDTYECEIGNGGSGNNIIGNVTYSNACGTSVNIHWDDVVEVKIGNTVDGYAIEYRVVGDTIWTEETTLVADDRTAGSYELTGLTGGFTYEYRVSFFTDIGEHSDYKPNPFGTIYIEPSCGGAVACSDQDLFDGGEGYWEKTINIDITKDIRFAINPQSIPDRFVIYQSDGVTVLYDSLYIGSTYYQNDLIQAGIPQNLIRLGEQTPVGYETITGGQWPFFIEGVIPKEDITGSSLLITVNAPLTRTQWSAIIECIN